MPPTPTLAQGSRGAKVRQLQQLLNVERAKAKLPPIAVDGVYGPETAQAVKQFQTQHLNEVPRFGNDAMVAAETMPALESNAGVRGAPVGAVERGPEMAPLGNEANLMMNPAPPDLPNEGEAEGRDYMAQQDALARTLASRGSGSTDTDAMDNRDFGVPADPEGYGMASSAGPGMFEPGPSMAGETSDDMQDPLQIALMRAGEKRKAELASYEHGNSPMAGGEMEYNPDAEPDPNGIFIGHTSPYRGGPDFDMADPVQPDDKELALILALKGMVKRKQMMEAERRNLDLSTPAERGPQGDSMMRNVFQWMGGR